MEFTVPVDTDPAVTSAEFIRNFSQWRMKAATSPVVISNHGRNTHALISYDRLVNQRPSAGGTVPDALSASYAGLIDDLHECVLIIDNQGQVAVINRAACEYMKVRADAVVGRPVLEAFPSLENSYIHRNLIRTLRSGERYSGDALSLLRDGTWVRLDIVPVEIGAAVFFREVTDEINAFHLADAKQAIIRAMEIDGSIGYARLSVREAIERADSVLIDMLGVTGDAITRVKFSALLPQSRRAAFGQALESVLHREGPRKIESELVGRDGVAIPVSLSIVELQGAFAAEGAIVVITQRCVDG